MSKHIAIQARSENFDFTVIIKRTPELETMLRRRMDLASTVKNQDKDCWGLVFRFYDFNVYEDLDLGDAFDNSDVAVLDELLDLGDAERIDYGALVIDSDTVYLRFGIKHVPGLEETGTFEHVLFDKKSK